MLTIPLRKGVTVNAVLINRSNYVLRGNRLKKRYDEFFAKGTSAKRIGRRENSNNKKTFFGRIKDLFKGKVSAV